MLNAYYPMGNTAGRFRTWWRRLIGGSDAEADAVLDNTHLMRLAGRFARRVRAWAADTAVPLIDGTAGERKHLVAEEYLRTHSVGPGVFLILVARAPAMVWDVHRSADGTVIGNLARKRTYVNHCSFHIMDRQWGHLVIKMGRAGAVRSAGDPERPVPCQNSFVAADLPLRAREAARRYSLIRPPTTRLHSIGAVISTGGRVHAAEASAAALMRPVAVIVPGVLGQDAAEMSLAEGQHVIQALAAKCSREPFRVGICPWRAYRRLDYPRAVPGGNLIECLIELAVPIALTSSNRPGPLAGIHEQIAGPLGGSRAPNATPAVLVSLQACPGRTVRTDRPERLGGEESVPRFP